VAAYVVVNTTISSRNYTTSRDVTRWLRKARSACLETPERKVGR
jgi:hypothetical protein